MALFTPRQVQAFQKHRFARWSLYVLSFFLVLSLVSELVANSKPLVLIYKGHWYFPILVTETNADLGIESALLDVDYRHLIESRPDQTKALWPLIRFHPNESDRSLADLPSAPDRKHWLGTDDRGRDVAARLLYGLRNSLVFSIFVWIFSFFIGTIAGGVQGYFGGKIDFTFQRLIEIIDALPKFFLLVILVSILRPSLWLLILIDAILGWIGISYYIRGEFLRLRRLEFVEGARALGSGQRRILWKHILPNAMTPLITFSPFALTGGITALAGLDYLGFGLAPPAASWGELLNQAMDHFDHAWWLAVFPSLALMSTLLLLNFVGEGLREALDPRSTT